MGYIFADMRSSANFRTVFSESQNANPLDAELKTHVNAKWLFKVIQGHLLRCQWRDTKGLHSTPCLKKTVQTYFYHNFAKFRRIVKNFLAQW